MREPALSDLPFAPGDGPFRIKGVSYLDTFARHAELPGGNARVAELLPSDALRDYYRQSFDASVWYDVLPMLLIDAAAAKASGESLEDFLRNGTRRHAHHVFSGIYRAFVRLVVPSALGWALPRLASMYFDFGKVDTRRAGAQRIDGTVSALPLVMVEWYRLCALEFTLVALEYSGAVRPRFSWGEVISVAPQHGMAMCDQPFELTWSGAREPRSLDRL